MLSSKRKSSNQQLSKNRLSHRQTNNNSKSHNNNNSSLMTSCLTCPRKRSRSNRLSNNHNPKTINNYPLTRSCSNKKPRVKRVQPARKSRQPLKRPRKVSPSITSSQLRMRYSRTSHNKRDLSQQVSRQTHFTVTWRISCKSKRKDSDENVCTL